MNTCSPSKRFFAFWVTVCMILSVFVPVGLAKGTGDNTYPNAEIEFSGFHMQYDQNGGIQGFVNVTIKNINATGVNIIMNYDSEYIQPSDYKTNDIIPVPGDDDYEFEDEQTVRMFKRNRDVFPILHDDSGETDCLVYDCASFTNDTINLIIAPSPDSPLSTYIGEVELGSPYQEKVKCIQAVKYKEQDDPSAPPEIDNSVDVGVSLGEISFRIMDPAAFANITEDKLRSILSPVSDEFSIIYIAGDHYEYFYDDTVPVTWNVDKRLIDVQPAVAEKTVSAYGVYQYGETGTIGDLINYLNRNMNTVIQRYSDGEQLLSTIVWDNNNPENGFNITPEYDPKGGAVYEISQKYMDKTVTVRINVTKVTITGFKYDRRILTYTQYDRPQDWASLRMPDTITPILSGVDDMYTPPVDEPVQDNWSPNYVTEELKSAYPLPVSQTYKQTFEKSLFGDPVWLTEPVDFNWENDAIRSVWDDSSVLPPHAGEDSNLQIEAHVEKTGELVIEVSGKDGYEIPPDADFDVYLPDGTKLSTRDDDPTVTKKFGDEKVTITIDTHAEGAEGEKFTRERLDDIQSQINKGSEDDFSLSMEAGGMESEPQPFSFAPRENFYKYEGTDESDRKYVAKDYSGGRKSMFVVHAGQSLDNISTYIAFPDRSTIPAAYDGQTGYEPGALNAAMVVSWTIDGGGTSLPSEADQDVTLIGLLKDYTYTECGPVKNPDQVYLKLKVTTAEALEINPTPEPTPNPNAEPTPDPATGEAIKITTEVNVSGTGTQEVLLNPQGHEVTFEYDTKQVGYSSADVQTQTYTIENIGLTRIEGLTVRIASVEAVSPEDGSPSNFVMTEPPPVSALEIHDVFDTSENYLTRFKIRTKHALPVGTYRAQVVVGSNKDSNLGAFYITFKVTDKKVYRVTVDSGQAEELNIGYGCLMSGDGSTVKSNTYAEGEQVDVYAVVTDSAYRFKEWTSSPSVGFTDGQSPHTSFTMPSSYVTVKPTFEESPKVWIRPELLQDFNEGAETENQLRENTPPYSPIAYQPAVDSYRVIIDETVESNYVVFQFKEGNSDITDAMTVKVTANDVECPTTKDSTGLKYTSDLFDIHEGVNTVTIYTEYTDPSDSTKYEQTYTLTIVLRNRVSVTLAYGNSPFGLIEQDDEISDKDAAKAYCRENRSYDRNNVPSGAAKTYKTHYYTDAWTTRNYDENPYALFIYNDTPFVDPGYSDLVDSSDTAVPPEKVKRTLTFNKMTSDGGDLLSELENAESVTLTLSGEEQLVIDLTKYRIRPGAYSIEYSFRDIDGKDKKFTRPLIVLAKKGDLDISGTAEGKDGANNTDYDTLYKCMVNGFYEKILASSEEWAKIYAYRVSDVTEDRDINHIDADAIRNADELTPYYEPLPKEIGEELPKYNKDGTWQVPAPVPTEKPTLTFDYLGDTETLPNDTAVTPNFTDDSVNRVFWMGVGIKNPHLLTYFKDGIYSVNFAVDYDPTIISPASDFATRLKENNFSTGEPTTSLTKWPDTASAYVCAEDGADMDGDGRNKTLHVTILSKDDSPLRMNGFTADAADKTAYLLRIPFVLKSIPDGNYIGSPVSLHLDEYTFAIGAGEGGLTASASWEAADKTTPVNNLKNHFDGVEQADLFKTAGTYTVTGTVTGWNPTQPFTLEFYRTDELEAAEAKLTAGEPVTMPAPTYTFPSMDAQGAPLHGATTSQPDGQCAWEFSVPVSDRFDYRLVIAKPSHMTYSSIAVNSPGTDGTVAITNPEHPNDDPTSPIRLFVGDVNADGMIYLIDRVEIMHYFNRSRPWQLELEEFRLHDLNGDNSVNILDLDILKSNYGAQYVFPPAVDTAAYTRGGE